MAARSSPGVKDTRLSASDGADRRAICGAIAGEAARRKPTEVKIRERAEKVRIRRTGEWGGTDANWGGLVDEQTTTRKSNYEIDKLFFEP